MKVAASKEKKGGQGMISSNVGHPPDERIKEKEATFIPREAEGFSKQ